MKTMLLCSLLQLITLSSAGPPQKSLGLLAKRPSSAHPLEPKLPHGGDVKRSHDVAHRAEGISWLQAFSAAKHLAKFNTSMDLADSFDGPGGGCPGCSEESSCINNKEMQIQCETHEPGKVKGWLDKADANDPGVEEACPEGFKALQCCICLIRTKKMEEWRTAGKESLEANHDYRIKLGGYMQCMQKLLEHKEKLLDSFQEDSKELDGRVNDELDAVIEASADVFKEASEGGGGAEEKKESSLVQDSLIAKAKTSALMDAARIMAKNKVLASMSANESRILMVLQSTSLDDDACKEGGGGKSLHQASVKALKGHAKDGSISSGGAADQKRDQAASAPVVTPSPPKTSVQSLLEKSSGILQGILANP